MSGIKLWGELESPYENSIPEVLPEIYKAMDFKCLAKYNINEDPVEVVESKIELPPMDYRMIYGINLHKHIKHVSEMIKNVETGKDKAIKLLPIMPECPQNKRKHEPNNLNFIQKNLSDFSLGIGPEQPELAEEIINSVLTQCVATIFAHIGFETSYQSVLDVMLDVLKEFLKKICYLLTVAIEDEYREGTIGFPDIVDRVLTQIGMGGIKGLHDYYENRLICYQSVLEERCHKLNRHYQTLIAPKISSIPIKNDFQFHPNIQVKEEPDEVEEVNIPNSEMQITTADGKKGIMRNLSFYYLLNQLEQNTSGEDVENTISPDVASIPDSDLSSTHSLSPFGKKKHL